ncbi:ubiquinol-cytochrome c reductase iron-sulfur subunit [Chitinophaga defluvii]|uniref:Rieske (2Fe-2S) protein n=1 Tax=Chitinophaga defluvii TaxID=3163343 RepID=A0ABV2TEK2_9BACT|nr:Rieske (2Fe-2S) protein [Bacteroidota bacterium]MBS1771282.1 Rieske (2Fe-2S) protein [Bacteroidota bacterium]
MQRREFIKSSCNACLAGAFASLLPSCGAIHYISGNLNRDGILVDIDDFKERKRGKSSWRSYIIIRNEELKFPICIYRFSENDYSALWMQCAHQGAEVQVAGSYLQCPAHGSEYNNRGQVTNGPATTNLRSFPVSVINNQIFIDLRKV